MKIQNLMENAKIGHVLDVSVKQGGKTIYAYYKLINIRSENDIKVFDLKLSEEVKHLRNIENLDLEENSIITIDQWNWYDVVNDILILEDLIMADFIENQNVQGATEYALTLDNQKKSVEFLKTFSNGLVDLIEVARSHQSW